MSYGPLRFLANNQITAASMITGDTTTTGVVGGTEKTSGTGAATMYATGFYSGTSDRQYLVQIDSVTGGTEIGQATFHWRKSDSTTWEATGVTTSASLLTLDNGVKIAWTAGTGADFTLYDTWRFEAIATYGTGNMLDLDRNRVFRSGATFTLKFNLGSAKQVTAFALLDHNLTATTGAATLKANSSDSWSNPPYSQALTITDPLVIYLDQTYQYWRLESTDSALSYLQIGELYLGTYTELVTKHSRWGTNRHYNYTKHQEQNAWGVTREYALSRQSGTSFDFPVIQAADAATLLALQSTLISTTTGIIKPVLVHYFSDDVSSLMLMRWKNITEFSRQYASPGVNAFTMELEEQVKTRV